VFFQIQSQESHAIDQRNDLERIAVTMHCIYICIT